MKAFMLLKAKEFFNMILEREQHRMTNITNVEIKEDGNAIVFTVNYMDDDRKYILTFKYYENHYTYREYEILNCQTNEITTTGITIDDVLGSKEYAQIIMSNNASGSCCPLVYKVTDDGKYIPIRYLDEEYTLVVSKRSNEKKK